MRLRRWLPQCNLLMPLQFLQSPHLFEMVVWGADRPVSVLTIRCKRGFFLFLCYYHMILLKSSTFDSIKIFMNIPCPNVFFFFQTSVMNQLLPGWPVGFGFVLFVLFVFFGNMCVADRLTCLLGLTVTGGGPLRQCFNPSAAIVLCRNWLKYGVLGWV